jgi:hypothetical protein
LSAKLKTVTTDNLGDGALAVWASQNLDRLVRDPSLRRSLAGATFYEDFGVFGTKWTEIERRLASPSSRLLSSEMQETRQRAANTLSSARELTEALFNQYDNLLQDAYRRHPEIPGVASSDRFNMLPRDEQIQITRKAVSAIDRAISDPNYRQQQAQEFRQSVERMALGSQKSHERLKTDLVAHLEKERGLSHEAAKQLVDDFSKDVYAVYSPKPGDPNYGRFASWQAYIPEDTRIGTLLVIDPMGEKTGFISSHPNGRPILQRYKEAADSLKPFAPGPFDINGRPGPTDFYFSFSGVNRTPMGVAEPFFDTWMVQRGKSRTQPRDLPSSPSVIRPFSPVGHPTKASVLQ